VDKLKARGFKNAVVLDEGILFWKQKGYPLTEKKP
jgi:rhodanese-related sulfurtransferase